MEFVLVKYIILIKIFIFKDYFVNIKVLSGIALMFVSSSLLASFQNQLSVNYSNEEDERREASQVRLDYLYLFSPVSHSAVPYSEEIFVSRASLIHLMAGKTDLDYEPDSFTGDSLEVDVNEYAVDGVYHIPETSFYLGLGYQQAEFKSKLNDADGDGRAETIVYITALEGPDSESDKLNVQLGYYINAMSRFTILLSQTDIEQDLGGLDLNSDVKLYAINYRKLFKVNDQYFSLNMALGAEKITINSDEFGNLGRDYERKKATLQTDYYFNQSTSVGLSAFFIKNEQSGVNEEESAVDYVFGVKHYFNPNAYVSVGYFDSEDRDSDGYNINAGYRF